MNRAPTGTGGAAIDRRYDPRVHHRRSVRLAEFDYSQPGAYFVTVCTDERVCWLGTVTGDEVWLSAAGYHVLAAWEQLADRFPGTTADALVVMPNHVHVLVVIADGSTPPTLGALVRAVKAASARSIHEAGLPEFRWQRNYYEHVVRDERELVAIREYIAQNPSRWAEDSLCPAEIAEPRGL